LWEDVFEQMRSCALRRIAPRVQSICRSVQASPRAFSQSAEAFRHRPARSANLPKRSDIALQCWWRCPCGTVQAAANEFAAYDQQRAHARSAVFPPADELSA
jgi:hypothetical protein